MTPYYSELELGKNTDHSVQTQVRKETGGSIYTICFIDKNTKTSSLSDGLEFERLEEKC